MQQTVCQKPTLLTSSTTWKNKDQQLDQHKELQVYSMLRISNQNCLYHWVRTREWTGVLNKHELETKSSWNVIIEKWISQQATTQTSQQAYLVDPLTASNVSACQHICWDNTECTNQKLYIKTWLLKCEFESQSAQFDVDMHLSCARVVVSVSTSWEIRDVKTSHLSWWSQRLCLGSQWFGSWASTSRAHPCM